jgi:hypothetical protein
MPGTEFQSPFASPTLSHGGTLTGMPAGRQQRPKRFNYRALPVWLQWVLPFGIAIVAVVALVAFVNHQTNDTPSEAPVNSPNAIVAQNKAADAVMSQEQEPHTAKTVKGATPADSLKIAIAAWLNHQISIGTYGGPLSKQTCTPTAGSTAARVAFYCAMVTANVTYPFYGVVMPASGTITYCQKIRYPPVYGMPRLMLSKRCLAS